MKCTGLLAVLAATAALPAAAQEISDGKVKIGILNDQSGVYADFGGKWSYEAAQMAAEDYGGTVLDAPIEIVTADHQNKPDIASNIAREWYDTEQVDSIMELTTSSVALAVQGLSKEKKKIDIVTGAATTELTGKQCSPYGFHWAYDTHALAVGTGGALVKAGGDTWFFLTADYAFGYSLEEQTGTFVKDAGGEVVGAVRHPLATTDFSSFLLQAQSLRRQGHRPRQRRPRHRERDQERRRSSASSRAARSSPRCSSPSPRSTASASRRRRACP